MGTVTVTAPTGGDYILSSPDSASLTAGLFVKLDGEAYEIESVDPANSRFTLVEVGSIRQHSSLPCFRTRISDSQAGGRRIKQQLYGRVL